MKAQDLRIGNLVKSVGYNVHFKVLEIWSDQLRVLDLRINMEKQHEIRCFEPIPLTPEWLERAGFSKIHVRWYHTANLVTPIIQGNGFYMNNVLEEIKYVHQLQNLFHCLVGKELEFNLDNLN